MRTTYLTTLKTSFNPFSTTSRTPRFFLQLLPANAHKTIKISQTVLPRTSTNPAILELGFKDGKQMKFSWAEPPQQGDVNAPGGIRDEKQTTLQDVVEEVERHARVLGRQEELAG